MTEREMAIVSAYTGVLLGRFCDMHKYIEQIMKRPVFTHEMGSKKIMEEIKCRSKKDFYSLADSQHGREPDKVKPLAQYLDEYIEHEVELGNVHISCQGIQMLSADYDTWQGLLEQALDAYESTENVKIRIERFDMYQVGVIVKFEDGTEEQNKFDFWGNAAAWIEYLANENESLPAEVKMWIIR